MNLSNAATISLSQIFHYPWQKNRLRLFPGNYEVFCLLIPALFAVLLIIDMFFFQLLTGTTEEGRINRFVTSLFFFNSIHVYFTFACLFTVPEFKNWIESVTNGKPWLFWREIAGVVAITSFLTAIAYFNFPITKASFPLLAIVVVGIIPNHHVIMQLFGLSMLYNSEINKRFELTDGEKQVASACAQRERRGFNALMGFFFSSILLVGIRYYLELDWPALSYTNYVLFGFVALSALFIVINSLFYPYALNSNKPLFLLRLFYYPLLPLSPFADSALRACHGTEYLCVTGTISKNSSMTQTMRSQFVSVLVLLSMLGAVFMFFRDNDGLVSFVFDGGYREVPKSLKVLAYTSIVLTYTHYYLDRRLFRFRNPVNREHILPLLSRDFRQ